MDKTLIFEITGIVGLITINRPQALNALNSQVFTELNLLLDEIEVNTELRSIIITGTGKSFVAGADIAEMSEMNSEQAKLFAQTGHDTFNRIANLQIPVIAAINGFALGGGCELAMACDIRVANTLAKFGQPEVNLGLIPGYCGTQRLSRIIGLNNALHLLLTGDMIDSTEAQRLGLVQKVTEPNDLMAEAQKIASKIASKGKIAIQKAKATTVKGFNMNFSEASDLEINEFASLFGNGESLEGMKAFLEKRKPNW